MSLDDFKKELSDLYSSKSNTPIESSEKYSLFFSKLFLRYIIEPIPGSILVSTMKAARDLKLKLDLLVSFGTIPTGKSLFEKSITDYFSLITPADFINPMFSSSVVGVKPFSFNIDDENKKNSLKAASSFIDQLDVFVKSISFICINTQTAIPLPAPVFFKFM